MDETVILDIFCFGKVSLRLGAISFLFKNNIPVHFFNKYGFYIGSLYPRDFLIAGKV
ncbi:MAG: CRISPR-associated endonuclease Cas1 [Candidatus Altarchaeaceae archaeon]